MENLRYLSVMTPPSATGVLTLSIQTFNVPINLTLTYNITGLSSSDTEISTATKIYSQLTAGLSSSQVYLPTATSTSVYFPNRPVIAMFDIQRTDHIIALTSQCEYDLTITTNTVGTTISLASNPTPVTLAEAKNIGGYPLVNCQSGSAYSDSELVFKLENASAKLAGYLNNNIALTTYFYYDVTAGGPCIFVEVKPLTDFYIPSVKFKFSQRYPFNFPYGVSKDAFHVGSRNLGLIEYNHWQDVVEIQQPFDEGNEVIIPYIAGYYHIPQIIKQCAVEYMYFLGNNGSLESSSIDGISEKYRSISEVLKGYLPFLRKYMLR